MSKFEGRTILVADDEPDILNLLRDYLEQCGAAVLTAIDGNEAYEIALENSVDVIISDVRMPGVDADGMTLLRRVRETLGPIPALFLMTGYSDYEDSYVKSQGGIGLISKPFTIDQLEIHIEMALEEVRSFESVLVKTD